MYREGKMPFNVFQDYHWCFVDPDSKGTAEDVTLEAIEKYQAENPPPIDEEYDEYDYMLGGSLCICETPEDLKEIEGVDFEFADTHKRWPNMTDAPLGSDSCFKVHGEPEFIMFLLCSNNAGGNVFYIPKALWTDNVLNSLQ